VKTRARRVGILSILALLIQLWLPGHAATGAPDLIEDLRYRLAIMVWQDAARVRITLKRLKPDHFTAEITGEPQGLLRLLSGGQRERLQTEMVWRQQRLVPLVYREESLRGKKRRFKEYRFDYPRGRLELWEWHQDKGLTKKWQTDLSGPIYDPLSAFYNIRLGTLGPQHAGEASTIHGIPYPKPEAMEVRLGTHTDAGLKAMASVANPVFPDGRGEVYAYLDKQRVPHQAWTTASGLTIQAVLLPESAIMAPGPGGLLGPGRTAAPAPREEKPPSPPDRKDSP
jgi:hypothetical protein